MPETEICPECNSKEIKVKHGFIFCHDCGHIISTYNRNNWFPIGENHG